MEEADSLGWLRRDVVERQAGIRPADLALHEIATGRRWTYAELEADIRRAAAWLRGLKLESGARVALLARNGSAHAILFYACARAGAIFQPLNWRLSGPELAVLLEDAQPQVLIHAAEFEDQARTAMAAGQPRHVLETDAFAGAIAGCAPAPCPDIDVTAPMMLLYTSGTTGRPKGVIVTPKSAFFGATNFTFVGELTAGHAQLCDVPLFHVVGLLAILHASLLAGAAVHLNDRFSPDATLAALNDPALRISHYFCVPQMAQALTDHPLFAAADLAGLKLFTGGAPMPAGLTLALLDKQIRASNGYGMSENGTVLGVPLDLDTARRKVGSAGLAAPAIEVRLVGADGRDVAEGETGEIWLRGPSITPGYWGQPEANAKAFSDGWFRTGDAARRDSDGFYFIVDRWKDMYITGGENVYPAEVENVLLQIEGVAEAAVFGVDDPRWGETGCAYLVLRPGAELDTARVLAWCDERLARYKRPQHVRIVPSLPRTASGKLQKDVLRRAFEAPKTPA
ncbi:AMP-binding protein [Phenylobacterium soli]|uniref:3-methylmercaptopropionyl-CoA ligase n=1 Tax=Phenylobacterium soli TaxID=2170551 RepID=A0A328AAK9_9CAUL|nr:AMP-binding protein [Phenylobacterium soli]RAK51783.1 feruloyl-CoA synthetase [Phenylobacterium soli]